MVSRWHLGFVIGAGMLLATAGIAKVTSSFLDFSGLTVADPIFGIKVRYVILLVGAAELIAAAACLFARNGILPVKLVAWLATGAFFTELEFGCWTSGAAACV